MRPTAQQSDRQQQKKLNPRFERSQAASSHFQAKVCEWRRTLLVPTEQKSFNGLSLNNYFWLPALSLSHSLIHLKSKKKHRAREPKQQTFLFLIFFFAARFEGVKSVQCLGSRTFSIIEKKVKQERASEVKKQKAARSSKKERKNEEDEGKSLMCEQIKLVSGARFYDFSIETVFVLELRPQTECF